MQNNLLNTAVAETNNLKPGEIFLVKDLFKGYEWKRIKRSDRLLLGVLFLNYVKSSDSNIKMLDKSPQGQQKYTIEA